MVHSDTLMFFFVIQGVSAKYACKLFGFRYKCASVLLICRNLWEIYCEYFLETNIATEYNNLVLINHVFSSLPITTYYARDKCTQCLQMSQRFTVISVIQTMLLCLYYFLVRFCILFQVVRVTVKLNLHLYKFL